jgi:hypothetical protein
VLPLFQVTIGGAIIAGSFLAVAQGKPWYSALLGFTLGLALLVGFGRLFRAGVSTVATEVVCRFTPWFEGNFYLVCVLLPLIGVATVAMANADVSVRGLSPGFLRFFGIVFLSATPLAVWGVARQWRRCQLRIGRSVLTVGVIKPGPTPILIPREDVEAITTEIVTPGTQVTFKVPQIAIVYRSADSGSPLKTIEIGPNVANARESGLQLSVKPDNLARALTVWKDGSSDDPELLDRVEAMLRGDA